MSLVVEEERLACATASKIKQGRRIGSDRTGWIANLEE